MAAKKSSPAFNFVVDHLKKNKKAVYADVAAAAQKKGLKIFPIMYGRAKAMLGLVPSAPRGSGKAAQKKVAAKAPAAKKAPVRRRAAAAASSVAGAGLDSIISQVKASEAEREGYRRALEKIQAILADVL